MATAVRAYDDQVVSQAGMQFKVGLVAEIGGFLLIAGLVLLGRGDPLVTGGALLALFFREVERIRRSTALHVDNLRADRDKRDAVTVADSIDDARIRDYVKAYLSMQFAGCECSGLADRLSDFSEAVPDKNETPGNLPPGVTRQSRKQLTI
jgi:hypothetical protein